MARKASVFLDDDMAVEPRPMEEREAKLTSLRLALIEGERSGPSAPFDFDAFLGKQRRPG